jgi:hypothetical protein
VLAGFQGPWRRLRHEQIADQLSISVNVCLSSLETFDQLSEGTTDLIIIDWEGDSAGFLRRIRKSHGWRKPTVVAVSAKDSLVPGADVLLRKPATAQSVAKSLKAAYSRMIYDHRRHARYAPMSAVSASGDKNRSLDVSITNIGDGGIGLSAKEELHIGDTLSFHLLQPGTNRAVYIQARVRWARRYGAVGCEFLCIPPADLNLRHDWLTRKNQIKKPVVGI